MINTEKRFKFFNKAIDYFTNFNFEIKSIHLYNDVIQLKVYNNRFGIRHHYIISIYDYNFTIKYIRSNCKHFKYKQKEISNNYKIKE